MQFGDPIYWFLQPFEISRAPICRPGVEAVNNPNYIEDMEVKMRLILPVLGLVFTGLLGACATTKNPSGLDRIQESRVLRVGTTGDYAPFSKWTGSEFEGIDMELARDLGKSLGAEVVFVKTSWPTLLEDLQAGKFDVAMSGISKKLNRQRVGMFSDGYVSYGKMGIAKCSKARRFGSLKAIDKKGVTLMVNPGGTNESFARVHIKAANIKVHPSNSEIFDQILKGNADLMITDSVEVYYQAKKHQGKLCPTMKEPITKSEIAVLMGRDVVLKEYVDTWLHLLTISGKKDEVLGRFIKN